MSVFPVTQVNADLKGKKILMETGRLANQADGSVWIQCGGTVVLVTVCSQSLDKDFGFFPLTVEYSEKMYAAGRIPGSFFRREIGRPSERETLVSRLIDRPLRPLFPDGYRDEVQVLASVLSSDQENNPDVLAVTGASLALGISSVPFNGPIAGIRVGRVNGSFIANPTSQELEGCDLNFVIAASHDAVVMVEGEALFVSEEVVADALAFAHEAVRPLLASQEELIRLCGKEKQVVQAVKDSSALKNFIAQVAKDPLQKALTIAGKMERREEKKKVKELVFSALTAEGSPFAEDSHALSIYSELMGDLEKEYVRTRIQREGIRIDGRDTKTVRPILIETSSLPRAHGSAIFARGETKSLVVTTLGSGTDGQRIESLMGDSNKRFMLHYNFPPFSVGEVKPVRVSRREIGHGALAEKALRPILPEESEFPFTVRIVAETMESNGSSSMAAVCGGCLSLMDAGVPIKAPVAGIAMGLIKEGDDFIVLTDILGDEDALGDMDFKIAGTANGLTAVQMDIKIAGLSMDIMRKALAQAKEARLHILQEMAKALSSSRQDLSPFAPQYCQIDVNPDAIRLIIGPGGKNIKAITAETGASIDINDSGQIAIFAPTQESMEKAKAAVLAFDQHAELGKNYENAKVVKVLEIGCIVELAPNLEALVHVSQLDTSRVENVADFVKLGDTMTVKVIEIVGDKTRASRKAVLLEEQGVEWSPEKTARPDRGDRPDRDRSRNRGPRDSFKR